jgi:YidC/Oxa1 family membrane protein insertase
LTAVAPDAPSQNAVFKQWGVEGEPGSYIVWFDRRGGSIWSIWLLDHFKDVEARNRGGHQGEDLIARLQSGEELDYYRLVRSLEPPGQPLEPFMLLAPGRGSSVDFSVRDASGEERVWEVEELDDGGVRFRLDGGQGLELEKVYRPRYGRREFELEITLRSTGEPGQTEGTRFDVDLLGLALVNLASENVIGNPAVTIVQQVSPNGRPGEVTVLPPGERQGATSVLNGIGSNPVHFAGSTNRFFGAFMWPLDQDSGNDLWDVSSESMPRRDNGEILAWSVPRARYSLRLRVPRQGQTYSVRLGCYVGPKSFRVFDEDPDYQRFAAIMEQDLTPPCFCTIPGAGFMAGVLLKLLGFFQGIVVSWGAAIIMLTLLVRGLLAPLNFRMQKSMRAFGAKMARLKPEMDAMKKRYEKDPKAYQKAMMEFNRKHKVVPPIGGCLPIFLTMPVWIGLFTALRVAYDLRQQPFLAWIDDLSQPDALIEGGLSWVPFYFNDFNLLPLIMMALWYWAQSSTPLPTDPQQRQMMKIMRFMPFFIGVMLYNYASGLMLYMITSSSWALVEMRITRRLLGPMPTAGGIAPMTPM